MNLLRRPPTRVGIAEVRSGTMTVTFRDGHVYALNVVL
jgi:hypothetical protein